jgi:hypothetical protein
MQKSSINNDKLNSAAYKEDNTPRSSQLHPRNAGMDQPIQIIKCNAAY